MSRSRWRVHAERVLYASPWVSLALAEVEPPGAAPFDHHVVRMPGEAVAAVVRDGAGRVLAIHRHRFITDREGWEVPAGKMEPGETPEAAAAREVIEETGWTVTWARAIATGDVAPGVTDLRHHVVLCGAGVRAGEPEHPHESDRVAWLDEAELLAMAGRGEVPDGYTQYALLAARCFG